MNKQEYHDAISRAIATERAYGVCETSIGHELNKIKDEYIASLEASDAKLLDAILDKAIAKLAYFGCPSGEVLLACDKNSDDNACPACWREYLLAEAEAEEKKP